MEAPASQRFVLKPNKPKPYCSNVAIRFDCSKLNEATVLFPLEQTANHLLLKAS